MPLNPKIRVQKALGNFDYNVSIQTATGESERLTMGVDQVSGLGDAVTNTIRYRDGGMSNTSMKPIPGLSTAEPVTFSGIVMADMKDILELQGWHQECQGKKLPNPIGGYYRTIVIQHLARTDDNVDLLSQETEVEVRAKYTLSNCIVKSLKMGDLDANAQNFHKYTLTVEFQDMKVG